MSHSFLPLVPLYNSTPDHYHKMAILAALLDCPYLVQGICLAILALLLSSVWNDLADEVPYRRIPLIGKSWSDITNKKAKSRFTQSARALIAEGFSQVRHLREF